MEDRGSLFIESAIQGESGRRRDRWSGRGSGLGALEERVLRAGVLNPSLKDAECAHRSKEGIHRVSQKFTGRGSLNGKALE